MLSEWDSTKLTPEVANKVLSIGRKIDNSQVVTEKLENLDGHEIVIETENFVRGVKRGLTDIDAIQDIPVKRILCTTLSKITEKKTTPVFVSLCWKKRNEHDEYILYMRQQSGRWKDDKYIYSGPNNHFIMYPLKPGTKYEFRVMVKNGGVKTEWTEIKTIRTSHMEYTSDFIKEVEHVDFYIVDIDTCKTFLDKILYQTKEGKFK